MKRLIYAFVVLFTFTIANPSWSYTLYWFTGAGIKRSAMEIAKLYNSNHKNTVVVIAGGSGAVLNEMVQSKRGDIYTVVDEFFLKKAIKYGIVTRYKKILKLTPVFAINPKDKGKIKSIEDLAKSGVKIAGGNPKTFCLGLTLEEILNKMPKTLAKGVRKNMVVKCMNVLQIIGYVKSGTVDAGIVLDKALLQKANLPYITIPSKFNVYRYGFLAQIAYSKHPKLAHDLYTFILNHLYIYKRYGFTVIDE